LVAIELKSLDEARALFGPRDRHLRLVREKYQVQIVARDGQIKVEGDEAQEKAAAQVLGEMLDAVRSEGRVPPETLDQLLSSPRLSQKRASGRSLGGGPEDGDVIEGVRLRTPGQKRYAEAMRSNALVFSIGPAGTGKTFLAVLMAIRALKRGEVTRIILSRPAVEAGEKLGYLPGDMQAKVNPYLRPLYDALNDLLGFETVKKYLEREVIEIVPLAYMRGRTLSRSFIILDEAQNTTRAQMKMFLTRMGEGSRVVVTGDVTQIDLPPKTKSGLLNAQSILQGVEGISFQYLTTKDIVRHPLVWKIVEAYEHRSPGVPGAAKEHDE
jgi:phosphate starvation-inducible protein PhoH and related proteins